MLASGSDAGDGLSIVARIQNRAGEARAAEGDPVTVGWHISDTAIVGAGDGKMGHYSSGHEE